MQQPLKIGDVLNCPHCRRWHPVVKRHTEGTDYTLRMLYFDCRRKQFYAGQQDHRRDVIGRKGQGWERPELV